MLFWMETVSKKTGASPLSLSQLLKLVLYLPNSLTCFGKPIYPNAFSFFFSVQPIVKTESGLDLGVYIPFEWDSQQFFIGLTHQQKLYRIIG